MKARYARKIQRGFKVGARTAMSARSWLQITFGRSRQSALLFRRFLNAPCRNICTLLIGLGLPGPIQAGQFHFPLGITYASGIDDAVNKLDDLYTAAGYSFDENVVIPIGLSFSPYYEFDSGLGIGLHAGPTSFIVIETTTGFFSSDTDVSYIIPVGADLRYTFLREKNVSPYLRVGVRYPIVGGPNLDSSEVGPFGAVGLDFWRTKKIGMGAEIGYDASQVTVKGPIGNTKDLTFAGFTATVFVRF